MPLDHAGMSASDLRAWAKEEIIDAIDEMITKKREDHDLDDATDELYLLRERNRVAQFLRLEATPKGTRGPEMQRPSCCGGEWVNGHFSHRVYCERESKA